jgi:hypothetical protein
MNFETLVKFLMDFECLLLWFGEENYEANYDDFSLKTTHPLSTNLSSQPIRYQIRKFSVQTAN